MDRAIVPELSVGIPNGSASNSSSRGRTRQTNGKAERFIQTSLREWAYARAYNTSAERTAELPRWLHRYNWRRPPGSIGSKPPIGRLGELVPVV
jgi:transposase InsO family protein